MVITIDRKKFIHFQKDDEFLSEWVQNRILLDISDYNNEYDDNIAISNSELEQMTEGIIYVIKKNESIIEKYGIEKYIDSDYPAKDEVSGYYYRTGTMVLCPFDWSLDNNDNEFDYSFTLARML